MEIIVAVDRNWGIGKKGDLLVKIPDDIQYFKSVTTGNVVVMGRRTFESLPNRKPLPDRVNIIVTKNTDYKVEGATVVHSVEEALEEVKKYPDKKIYNIGGGRLFNAMLEYCNVAYVTYIDYAYDADTYFPNLDKMPEWILEHQGEEKTYFDLTYVFRKYVRRK
uniref:dihydrofolate reductase n=1 Tax=Parasporobacterium paucivorans TaxID=115544 RepID=UPI00093DED75